MIKEISRIFKLMRYAHGLSSNLWFGGIFFTLGLLFSLVMPVGTNRWVSCYLIFITTVWPAQLISSLGVSHMVQASARSKKLQTSIPAMISVGINLILYLAVLLKQYLQLRMGMYTKQDIVSELLLCAGLIVLVSLQNAAVFKCYYVSIAFYIIMMFVHAAVFSMGEVLGWFHGFSLRTAVIIGFAAIFAGGAAYYGISLLLYKRPLDKNSQPRLLKKAM